MADFRTTPFRYGTPRARILASLLAGSILVGCTGPGGTGHISKYEPTFTRMTEERLFAQSLRQRYLELATYAYDRGDLDRSDFYSLRALMAVEGKLVEPTRPDVFALDHGTAEEAQTAYERLSTALMGGIRTGAPDLAARAQAAYDCWLLESGPDGDAAAAQSCRYNTFDTIARLDAASVGAQVAHAGGHHYAAPRTVVIDGSTPAQTIQANGVTIEVIHQAAAPAVAYRSAPTVQYAAAPPAYPASVPYPKDVRFEPAPAVPAPMTYVAADPMPASYQTVDHGAAVETYAMPSDFEALPVISAQDADMLRHHGAVAAPAAEMAMMERIETAPVGAPINIIPEAELPPMPVPAADPRMIETAPVFGAGAEPVPMVSLSETAIEAGGAARALIDAQAALQSDFAIYFGFDSDEVTPEAEDVLADALERIKLSGATQVTLTGFTDSMGDARYNQLLAMRRAQSVRKYLQEKTGGAVSFEILPIGEVQAVQNGGDGVMEALNRRVELAIR